MSQRVRHIALFRWKEASSIDEQALVNGLKAIVRGSEGASNLTIGRGLGLSGPSGFDFALTVDFPSEESYLAYREGREHQRLLKDVLIPAAETVSAIQLRLEP